MAVIGAMNGYEVMISLCISDLFKRHYKVEPATLQFYSNLLVLPSVLNLLYGSIIDTKVIKQRRYLIIGCGAIITLI